MVQAILPSLGRRLGIITASLWLWLPLYVQIQLSSV